MKFSINCGIFICHCGSGRFVIKSNGYLYCSNRGTKAS